MNSRWEYRIVKKDDEYTIHRVFIDENNDIAHISDTLSVCEHTLVELTTKVEKALDYPVIDYRTGECLYDEIY